MRVFFLLLGLVVSLPASASLMRFTVRPGATHGLQLKVERTATEGLHLIKICLPANQQALKHVYRVELRLSEGGRPRLLVPTPLKSDGSKLCAEVWSRPSDLPNTVFAIRVGKAAPLAETVYEVDLGAFLAGEALRP